MKTNCISFGPPVSQRLGSWASTTASSIGARTFLSDPLGPEWLLGSARPPQQPCRGLLASTEAQPFVYSEKNKETE